MDKDVIILLIGIIVSSILVFVGTVLYAGLGPALITLGCLTGAWIFAWLVTLS